MSAVLTKHDKSKWGEGPWQTEPDHVDFRHSGLPCILNRAPLGHWCGYVGVPPGHPAHGKNYNDVDAEVHGGLTYGEKCQGPICHTPEPGESDDVFWFGFDCAHSGDFSPSMNRHEYMLPQSGYERYRDKEYVEAETKQFAEQLAALAKL